MIFTAGLMVAYERNLNRHGHIMSRAREVANDGIGQYLGLMVFNNTTDAENYLSLVKLDRFYAVYAVYADWEYDTWVPQFDWNQPYRYLMQSHRIERYMGDA